MDDNKNPEPIRSATPQPERRNFMDIQPPQPAPKSPEPTAAPMTETPAPETPPLNPEPANPEPVVAEPPVTVPETHQEKSEAASNGLSPELLAQAQKETAKPKVDPAAAKKAPKNRRPAVIIVLALLVFAGLSSVAVYAYLQSQKKLPAEQNQMIEVEDHSEHENQDDASTETPAENSKGQADTPIEKAEDLDKAVDNQNAADETQAPDATTPESGADAMDMGETTP